MADPAAEKTGLQVVATSAAEKRIFVVRGRQVMLDEDLADLYGVETKRLIEQVKRNLERFPEDFMFQLHKDEAAALRSQIATSNVGSGGRRYAPYVFTEQGVAMLSSVLRSKTAIAVNIEIMRAFVELRRVAGSFQELQKRLDQMELDIGARLSEHDEQLRQIFEALRQLIKPPLWGQCRLPFSVLYEHPREWSSRELREEIGDDTKEAIVDLLAAGLVKREGDYIRPTREALAFHRLELS